jgi:hypothetical protein
MGNLVRDTLNFNIFQSSSKFDFLDHEYKVCEKVK